MRHILIFYVFVTLTFIYSQHLKASNEICQTNNIAYFGTQPGDCTCDENICYYTLKPYSTAEQVRPQVVSHIRDSNTPNAEDIVNKIYIKGKYALTFPNVNAELTEVIASLIESYNVFYTTSDWDRVDLTIDVLIFSEKQASTKGFAINFNLDSVLQDIPRATLADGKLSLNLGNLTSNILNLSAEYAKSNGLQIYKDNLPFTDRYNGFNFGGIGSTKKVLYFTSTGSVTPQTESADQTFSGSLIIDETNPQRLLLSCFDGTISRELNSDRALQQTLRVDNCGYHNLVHGQPKVILNTTRKFQSTDSSVGLSGVQKTMSDELYRVYVVATAYNRSLLNDDDQTSYTDNNNRYAFTDTFKHSLPSTSPSTAKEIANSLEHIKGVVTPSPFGPYTKGFGLQLDVAPEELSKEMLETPIHLEVKGKGGLKGFKAEEYLFLENLLAGPFMLTGSMDLQKLKKYGDASLTVKVEDLKQKRSSFDISGTIQMYYAPEADLFIIDNTKRAPRIKVKRR